ncbi:MULTISPECIES: YgjV family protein [unclassified Pseudoalteromonas]|uniref:YgjV family protein n=1 Tax=unclassified Pseudoalteromonas TaxID=194690 RepID=UPI0015FB4C9F|nr:MULTISPECIES: YgjV family protein [unclassified Pseudoalteromonas]MBB1379322.1 YgjV family protein [Pseudoalteromonas sp. SR43-2]MBB1455715.1 YgjV family protein [Pseudoalteromonas sp. SG43-5]
MFDSYFAQALGFISYILAMLCFIQKDDRRFKIMMILMNLNHALHFYLLNAVTSSLCCLFAAGRTATSLQTKAKWVAVLFIILTALIGYLTVSQWTDYIAIAGSCIGTYALFCLNGIKMRWVIFMGSCLWLINNIIVGSLGGMLLEATVIILNLITIYKLHKLNLRA